MKCWCLEVDEYKCTECQNIENWARLPVGKRLTLLEYSLYLKNNTIEQMDMGKIKTYEKFLEENNLNIDIIPTNEKESVWSFLSGSVRFE